jgi:hypothetical protein
MQVKVVAQLSKVKAMLDTPANFGGIRGCLIRISTRFGSGNSEAEIGPLICPENNVVHGSLKVTPKSANGPFHVRLPLLEIIC